MVVSEVAGGEQWTAACRQEKAASGPDSDERWHVFGSVYSVVFLTPARKTDWQSPAAQSTLPRAEASPFQVETPPLLSHIPVVAPGKYFSLLMFSRPVLFAALIKYLEFTDWLTLDAVGHRSVRALLDATPAPFSSLRGSLTDIEPEGVHIGASNAW